MRKRNRKRKNRRRRKREKKKATDMHTPTEDVDQVTLKLARKVKGKHGKKE